jgi:hypothetical protein
MAVNIRAFEEGDIPACAALHQKAFSLVAEPGQDLSVSYASYFRHVFLNPPLRAEGIGAMVCEENGKIAGFLGVTPRPMRFRGRPILALLTSQFVVDPASRSLAGVRLMKTCLSGRQELTIADESNDISRLIWERLGGHSVPAHSLHWTAVLRPGRRMMEIVRPPRFVAAVSAPVAGLIDNVLARAPKSPIRRTLPPDLTAKPLEARDLLRFWHEYPASLIPDHDETTLRWMLGRLKQLEPLHGRLHAVTLWAKGQLAGAYAYHVSPDDVSHVVLFASQPAHEAQVLDHLLATAAAAGLSALTGRVPPRHIHAFSRASCLMSNRPKWTVVHSPVPEILYALQSGDDALAALDGEWFTHFNFRSPQG